MTNHIAQYLNLAKSAEKNLIDAFSKISKYHAFESDVLEMCHKFTTWSGQHLKSIEKLTQQFEMEKDNELENISDTLFAKTHMGGFGLLRDLQSLSVLVHETHMCWVILLQASKALRHAEMEMSCLECELHYKKEAMWLLTKLKTAAPQAMVVSSS
jgi:hypothetical protein